MHHLLVFGAGKIGSLIAFLFAKSNQYKVFLADASHNSFTQRLEGINHLQFVQLDAADLASVERFINEHQIKNIVSSLPYFHNVTIAEIAAKLSINYFDLTEDVQTTQKIEALSKQKTSAFVPQCGLAPGYISIVANDLMRQFTTLDTIKMRVGALPENVSNALQYSLTWSTDGLINEYGNLCYAIVNNKAVELQPLEGLEEIKIDGLSYEAFNTSGGIGSLADTYGNKVKNLSYKTIRYPGHCAKIKFLMNDLKLNHKREVLKTILEDTLPRTYQDVVLVYVSVCGIRENHLSEKNFVRKFYPRTIDGLHWSAIQLTTASALCSIVDIVLNNPDQYQGLVRQEQFTLDDFINNQFGGYFKNE